MSDIKGRVEALKSQVDTFRFDPDQPRAKDGKWKGVKDFIKGQDIIDRQARIDKTKGDIEHIKEGLRRSGGVPGEKPPASSTPKNLTDKLLRAGTDSDKREMIRKASNDDLRETLKKLPKDYTPGSTSRMVGNWIQQELDKRT